MAINTAGQTITGNSVPSDSPQYKVGRIVFDATAITATDSVVVNLGFTPKYICWENLTDRIKNDWITGECDIFTGDTVIDIKSSWSLTTFPLLASMGENSGYEWQLRAYMMLWDCPSAALA